MSYFTHFDDIFYNADKQTFNQAVNILNSVAMKYSPIKDTTLYFYHSIQDGEKPEDISYRFYETTEYHWLIILLNNVVNPYYDWLLDSHEMESHLAQKYGDDQYKIHHFENLTTGRWVDEFDSIAFQDMVDNDIDLPFDISPVSIVAYEGMMNEEKREIRVIDARYIDDIIKQFEDLMSRDLLNNVGI